MPRRKTEPREEAEKAVKQLLGIELPEETASFIERMAEETGKDVATILREMVETGAKSTDWRSLTAPQLIACVNFLAYVDSLFYKRVYVVSPIEAVIAQADKYSQAIKKILESYATGLEPLVRKSMEAMGEEVEATKGEKKEEERVVKQNESLLEKAVDYLLTSLMDEIASRVTSDLADQLAPTLRDKIREMIEKGEVVIRLPGVEVVKGEKR